MDAPGPVRWAQITGMARVLPLLRRKARAVSFRAIDAVTMLCQVVLQDSMLTARQPLDDHGAVG